MAATGSSEPDEVVWEAPDADVWVLEDNHGDQITPVPMRRELEQAFADGFRSSFAHLGLPLSHIELRHINGWPYVSFFVHDVPRKAGDPPPAFVLKAVTRLHPGFRRRTRIAKTAIAERRAERFAAEWFAERDDWIRRTEALQRGLAEATDGPALAAQLRTVTECAGASMRRHFELVAGCIPIGAWLQRSAEWGLDPAEARQAVMHGVPVHAEARGRLARIADALGDVSPTSLDEIRAHSSEAAAALDEYVTLHGWWAADDSVSSPRIIDVPSVVIGSISATRTDDATGEPSPHDVLARLRSQVPIDERAEFDRLATDAQRAHAMLEDNSGILGAWAAGVAGETLRRCARWLSDGGRLHDPSHLMALDVDQIVELLEDESDIDADAAARSWARWEAQHHLTPPASLNGTPGPPPDPDVFPRPVAQLVGAMSTFLDDKFNEAGTVSGIGSSAAVGRAVVAHDVLDAIDRIEPGDILVTAATTPAYNSVLPFVAGVVVSHGGPSCHTAVVARELGIPALVGYADAMSIPDGSVIEIDPVAVEVRISPSGRADESTPADHPNA